MAPSYAAAGEKTFVPHYVQVRDTGTLWVAINGTTRYSLCKVNVDGFNNVNAAACRAMHSMLVAAKLSSNKVWIQFSDLKNSSGTSVAVSSTGDLSMIKPMVTLL